MDVTSPNVVITTATKTFTGISAKCIKLLGNGCTQVEAAKALGVSESQVSQWLADADFKGQVNALVAKTFEEQSVIDENYNKAEKKLSDRLVNLTEHMFDPDKVLRALAFLNQAKRRVSPNIGNQPGMDGINGGAMKPVALLLPGVILKDFLLSPNNEVIGINGKEVITLPSKDINDLSKRKREATDVQFMEVKTKHGPGPKDPWSNL